METNATFSDCRDYRYSLTRTWDAEKPILAYIGLNPSTADEKNNDPTITRCIKRAQKLGYGGIVMLNIFAFRTPYPDVMRKVDNPIGPENDASIDSHCKTASQIICAWGADGDYLNRGNEVRQYLHSRNYKLSCLGTTKSGHPRHPLYIAYSQQPYPLPELGEAYMWPKT